MKESAASHETTQCHVFKKEDSTESNGPIVSITEKSVKNSSEEGITIETEIDDDEVRPATPVDDAWCEQCQCGFEKDEVTGFS